LARQRRNYCHDVTGVPGQGLEHLLEQRLQPFVEDGIEQ
jgi:hypothetical protein